MYAGPNSEAGRASTSPTDSTLMEQLKLGDMSALEAIYMRYSSMVKAAVYRVSPRIIDADMEELTQDIFITLVKSAQSFDQTKSLKPWLYGIAVKKTAEIKRTGLLHRKLLERHQKATQAVFPSAAEAPSKQLEIREDLSAAFEQIPWEQHEILILHGVEGFKGEEIAEILGIEVNTVWTRLRRARARVLKNLKASQKKSGVR